MFSTKDDMALQLDGGVTNLRSPEIDVYNVCFVCLMMFNATFNNISVILWQSVLLVEEIGEPGENHRPVASH